MGAGREGDEYCAAVGGRREWKSSVVSLFEILVHRRGAQFRWQSEVKQTRYGCRCSPMGPQGGIAASHQSSCQRLVSATAYDPERKYPVTQFHPPHQSDTESEIGTMTFRRIRGR